MVEPTGANGDAAAPHERKKLIEVNHLVKYFPVRAGLLCTVLVSVLNMARLTMSRVRCMNSSATSSGCC